MAEFKAQADVLTPAELREAQARVRAAEAAGDEGAARVWMTSPGIVHTAAGMHPDHDEPCVFSPGELLPAWVVEALLAQQPKLDHGVYTVGPIGRRKPPREAT